MFFDRGADVIVAFVGAGPHRTQMSMKCRKERTSQSLFMPPDAGLPVSGSFRRVGGCQALGF